MNKSLRPAFDTAAPSDERPYAVRHILARLTHWVDQQCGIASHFEDYFATRKARPYEVEHIWPDKYERFRDWFPHEADFDRARNRIGDLVLLQRGPNQSLSDLPYEEKRNTYVAQGQTILARSLHPLTYEHNPSFQRFLDRTGLPFRPIDHFDREAQQQRQELYVRVAEWIWNPSKLDLDGEKPPIHHPLREEDDEDAGSATPVERGTRFQLRRRFWTTVVEHNKQVGGMHAKLTPTDHSWLGVREEGLWWALSVTQDETGFSATAERVTATMTRFYASIATRAKAAVAATAPT